MGRQEFLAAYFFAAAVQYLPEHRKQLNHMATRGLGPCATGNLRCPARGYQGLTIPKRGWW
jgi:hypothetical protein